MADLAHNASGSTSSEPAGIAVREADRPASSDKGKLRVFISYSRDDLDFADQLTAALDFSGFECFIDREGISGGEEWKWSLGGLISEADTVVFVLTPNSARSPICDWEVEEATRLNKRILPILCRPLEGVSPPPRLRELNYIFFYKEPKVPGSDFGTGLAKLVTALNTDFDWLRQHTRYLQRAIEWDTGGRAANRLLSGNDIGEAKAWVTRRPKSVPEPTALQLDFIRASEEEAEARLSEQRKQLDAMAGAQAEREKALHDAEEALKQAADAQRRRAKIRNIALVAVSGLAAVALMFGGVAYQQRMTAEKQRQQADTILARATTFIRELPQFDIKTKNEAFSLFQAGANLGNAQSMSSLGWYYLNGYGVKQDYAKAREWYEKAAAKDNTDAMLTLGDLYRGRYGMPSDYAKAREWYEKAAAKDDTAAMTNLGALYDRGQGGPQDYAKAREWYEKAAAEDDIAMTNLGALFATGRGVPQDYSKAREWWEKAAAKDNAVAMTNLGILYYSGQGVAQDYSKAREWYEKAAAEDYADAMSRLGALYADGHGVAQDYEKARDLFEKAAAKDDAYAMVNLGALYQDGHGVPQDYDKAREWFEKAAAKDDAEAMYNLGVFFGNGQGVPPDYAKAREWYEKAVDKGMVLAMSNLGLLYADGLGVPQDYAKARDLFEKAAAKDIASAMVNLGGLYQNGQGVKQDYAKARDLYEKAAAKDNTDAMFNLAVLYHNGQGVPQDNAQARAWLEKAADLGDAQAKMRLEKLAIEEAQSAGRYDDALSLEEAFAAKLEAEETKRDGKPDEQVATELNRTVWYALFAKQFTKALSVADHAHTLFPSDLSFETNRAHALMFMGHDEEAKTLYLAYKGQPISGKDHRLWERVIGQDFADFRKAGLTSPMMADIEKELGISR